jgi:hypothetical protein
MKRGVNRLWIVSVLLVIGISVESSAQQATSFDQLQLLVKPGDNIYVTDTAGNTTKGRISELSASTIGLTPIEVLPANFKSSRF